MNSVGGLLRAHPVVSALILVAALAILALGSANIRSPESDVVNTFLIGLALVLMAVAAYSALIHLPRRAAGNENLSALMQWVEAISIYLIGWLGWFLFGLPSWLAVVGAALATVVLVSLIVSGERDRGNVTPP